MTKMSIVAILAPVFFSTSVFASGGSSVIDGGDLKASSINMSSSSFMVSGHKNMGMFDANTTASVDETVSSDPSRQDSCGYCGGKLSDSGAILGDQSVHVLSENPQ